MKKEKVKNTQKTAAMIMLALMVLSILGFAMVGIPFSNSEDGNPKNLPFGQYEQQGQTFWAAIKNEELFIFETIDGYEERQDMNEIAQKIKTLSYIEIYLDEGYSDSNIPFLVENKLSNAYGYTTQRISEEQCNENTLIITYDSEKTGGCMILKTSLGEEQRDSNILAYHMVKN